MAVNHRPSSPPVAAMGAGWCRHVSSWLVLVLAGSLLTGLVRADTTVKYNDFRGLTFGPLATQIADELTPCGCTSPDPTPTFTFDGVTPPLMTFDMLNTASQLLFQYMGTLMKACGCTKGTAMATSALQATPHPSSSINIATSDVDQFTGQIANVISSLLATCCDPAVSTRQYTFITGTFTYDEAVADASKRGGTLATIATRNDCMRVTNIMRTTGAQSIPINTPAGSLMFAWIGLRNQAGKWQWPSPDVAYQFHNWGYLQPLTANNCASYAITNSPGILSTWAALSCDAVRLPYILETVKESTDSDSQTVIIIAIIVVLVVVFCIATGFIVAKRFIPACRGKTAGRRATAEERERRQQQHLRRDRRRTRGRGTGAERADDEDEGAEMTGLGADATTPRRRRRSRSRRGANDDDNDDHNEEDGQIDDDVDDSAANREAGIRLSSARGSHRHLRRQGEVGGAAPPSPQQLTRRRTESLTAAAVSGEPQSTILSPSAQPASSVQSPRLSADHSASTASRDTPRTAAAASLPSVATGGPAAAVPTARRRTAAAAPSSGGSVPMPAAPAPQQSAAVAAAADRDPQYQARLQRARLIREQQRRLLLQAQMRAAQETAASAGSAMPAGESEQANSAFASAARRPAPTAAPQAAAARELRPAAAAAAAADEELFYSDPEDAADDDVVPVVENTASPAAVVGDVPFDRAFSADSQIHRRPAADGLAAGDGMLRASTSP